MSELRSAAGETVEFQVGPIERDEAAFEIASSTGAQITTELEHGYSAGDHVRVEGHVWNPINGAWVVASVQGAKTFTLSGADTSLTGGASGTVTRIAAVDLSAAGTEMVFTAKRRLQDTDAQAVVTKGSESPLTGIVLNQPVTSRKNLATITIDAADTQGLLDSEDLYFDVQLAEDSGRVTRVDRGIWKVGAAVSRA